VVLEGEETGRITLFQQTSIPTQVAVIGRVDGIESRVVSELEREERRGAPRDIGVHLDFIPGVAQVGEAPTAARA